MRNVNKAGAKLVTGEFTFLYHIEYERNGVSNLFMFFGPLEGQRHVVVTDQRTVVD